LSVLSAVSSVSRVCVDVLFPCRCVLCGQFADNAHALCGVCWKSAVFIADPYCDVCGYPLPFAVGDELLCGGCMKRMPQYERARSVFCYEGAGRHLITKFKYGDATHMLPYLTQLMIVAGRSMIAESDVIMPVPLHRLRLWQRRYNQAALLVRCMAKECGVEGCTDALVRLRRTVPQSGLSYVGRRKNVQGAIAVRRKYRGVLRGRRVLLVDDVMTTGATIDACVAVLRKEGVKSVKVLTLARTVKR